ncbi:MAG: 3-keto-5-aminohexanoate cleavage protein [bacterium]|nr:3-keto-5-aminohexanoate cleavage protein [bacterium]
MGLENKCIVTCAMAGAATRKQQNEAVPYGIKETIDAAVECYKAGAAIVHIHVRDENGIPSNDPNYIKPVVQGIREKCPVLVNLSTAIRPGLAPEERITVVTDGKPDMASLNCGTMDFGLANWEAGTVAAIIFDNSFDTMIMFNDKMKEVGCKPELEVYDNAMVDNIKLIRKQGIFEEPLHFQFVFGIAGGVLLDPSSFADFVQRIPKGSTWSACGAGPNSFKSAYLGSIFGGNVRVGLEDNIYISGKTLAKSNAQLVEKAVKIVQMADREPATPEEARQILSLPKRK